MLMQFKQLFAQNKNTIIHPFKLCLGKENLRHYMGKKESQNIEEKFGSNIQSYKMNLLNEGNFTLFSLNLLLQTKRLESCILLYGIESFCLNSPSSESKQQSVWKWGYCFSCHYKIPFPPPFYSQHLKLQNELPLAAAQSLRSKKRQNLTKKLILGHLWNSIIRPIF